MQVLKISLAAARVNANFTQGEVAKELHVTKQTVINWEKGRSKPNPAQFYFMCKLYGVPEDSIILV